MVLRTIAVRVKSGERGDVGSVRLLFAKRRNFNDFVRGVHAQMHESGAAAAPVSQAAGKDIVDKPPTKRVSVFVRLYISFGYGWV
jgi:hypothetical protein